MTENPKRKPELSSVRKCPRCDQFKMFEDDVLNSKSHTHTGVMICNDCGMDEGLILQGLALDKDAGIRQVKWENKKF